MQDIKKICMDFWKQMFLIEIKRFLIIVFIIYLLNPNILIKWLMFNKYQIYYKIIWVVCVWGICYIFSHTSQITKI